MKNNFTPINKIPLEVFSLIPGYWESDNEDEGLITMTHVCRGWREVLIARSSLWTRLFCTNTDKTQVYIKRSKASPLELSLYRSEVVTYLEDAFLLVVLHIGRLRSLNVSRDVDLLQNLMQHLSCPIPLLRELVIDTLCDPAPVLEDSLFNGDLSSLRSLTLYGVTTHLPWKNLSNLTTFELSFTPEGEPSITQLLDFFEGAHRLRDITFHHSIPSSSNAPPERVLSLPSLKNLTIDAYPDHSGILLDHLTIPVGASLILEFMFRGDMYPLLHQQVVESPISPYSTCDRTASPTGAYNALYVVICGRAHHCNQIHTHTTSSHKPYNPI